MSILHDPKQKVARWAVCKIFLMSQHEDLSILRSASSHFFIYQLHNNGDA